MQTITLSIKGHIGELLLCGPKKGNPLGPKFFDELPTAMAELNADHNVRVILLRSQGPDFCFGLDLLEAMTELGPLLNNPGAAERLQFKELIQRWQRSLATVAESTKPVIAVVQGRCIGGGLDLISACDIRLASKDATISLRETRVAMTADIGSLQRLPYIIGQGATRELAYTGADIDAEHALRIGLVNHIYKDHDALLESARAMATQIANNSPLAVQGSKAVLDYCVDKSIEDGLNYVAVWNSAFLVSEDLSEAFGAFMQKRPAKYTGR